MTTDPAVTAAAEAIDGPGSTYLIQRGHVDIDDVARVVAAARPIIEAEVWDGIYGNPGSYGELKRRIEAEVRERIAVEIEASDLGAYADGEWVPETAKSMRFHAARIARGQS